MRAQIAERVLKCQQESASLLLWACGAIKVNPDDPFKLISGNYSPIYINCRLLISHPEFMELFRAYVHLVRIYHGPDIGVVAGGETAGIPFAAYAAQALSLPMVYVRKAAKGHGIAGLVEGHLREGAKILLTEDLVTDARSKLRFIEALRASGGVVEHVLVVFDRLQGGGEVLQTEGISLHAMTNMDIALSVAEGAHLIQLEALESVREYLGSPGEWHDKRKLPYLK